LIRAVFVIPRVLISFFFIFSSNRFFFCLLSSSVTLKIITPFLGFSFSPSQLNLLILYPVLCNQRLGNPTMAQAVEEWYKQMPVITRSYLTAAVVTTIGCSLDVKHLSSHSHTFRVSNSFSAYQFGTSNLGFPLPISCISFVCSF